MLQVKNTLSHPKTYGEGQDLRGCSRATWGQLVVTQTHRKRKKHWVGPVAWARFLEGNMEALRASLCWSEKEPLVFPLSVRKMGSDPQGPPPLRCLAAKQPWQKCWAERNTRWCQSCTEWTSMPPYSCLPPFRLCLFVQLLLSQLSDSFKIQNIPLSKS